MLTWESDDDDFIDEILNYMKKGWGVLFLLFPQHTTMKPQEDLLYVLLCATAAKLQRHTH